MNCLQDVVERSSTTVLAAADGSAAPFEKCPLRKIIWASLPIVVNEI